MTLALTFPGGKLRTITIPATAGNVVTNLTPGTRKRWIVLYGITKLDTDGTAADRYTRLEITDGTNVLHNLMLQNAVIANQLGYIFLGPGEIAGSATLGAALGNVNTYFSVKAFIIEGTDTLRITVGGGVVGDSYSGYIRVLELGL